MIFFISTEAGCMIGFVVGCPYEIKGKQDKSPKVGKQAIRIARRNNNIVLRLGVLL
jgi:hypothetical protein